MIMVRSKNTKSTRASEKSGLQTGCDGVKKPTKRPVKQSHGSRGQSEVLLERNDEHCFHVEESRGICSGLPGSGTFLTEKKRSILSLKLNREKVLLPAMKIKLQLFPVNDNTQKGLEKNGHNPFLELTLRARKKISSVLKHLDGKWGSSSVAVGEPVLLPYHVENLSNCRRWMLNDSDISAGDVYSAVGSPDVFRLRYGWFCNSEPTSFNNPSSSTHFETCLPSEDKHQGCNSNIEASHSEGEKVVLANEDGKQFDQCEATSTAVTAEKFGDLSVDPLDERTRANSGLGQPSMLCIDGMTNISIGGLLSEASLQGKFNNSFSKRHVKDAGLQSDQVISSSFDDFVAAQTSYPEVPRLEELRSSILDAEDTCHPFRHQKLSASASSQDGDSKPFKLLHREKVTSEVGLQRDPNCKEPEEDRLLCIRMYDDERSLGLRGIKWNDSLGPFDLGLPTTAHKLNGGDSASIRGFR